MKIYFFSILFLFAGISHSKSTKDTAPQTIKTEQIPGKPTPDKILECNERGCNCEGKGCSYFDPRIIRNASTVAITCSEKSDCGRKIVFKLKDKYGCKSSVQKIDTESYMAVSECLIMATDGPTICPPGTKSENILEVIKICLEVPGSGLDHTERK